MKNLRLTAVTLLCSLAISLTGQVNHTGTLLQNNRLGAASVSMTVMELSSGRIVAGTDMQRVLIPASVQKLVTTAAALEILGPDYTFTTTLFYTGRLNKTDGLLTGDLVIRGGGDPALGSERFISYYGDIVGNMTAAVREAGIRKISGKVIADDSFYDYNPVPALWVWEDIGNYYGAGAYGLSVFDNTLRIYLKTGKRGSQPEIVKTEPVIDRLNITSYLVAEGNTDKGFVYSAPYGTEARIFGTVPEKKDEFILKASIPDPPLLLAEMLSERLSSAGIEVNGRATTARLSGCKSNGETTELMTIWSPPLAEIVKIINHESVNLYAEHLVRQLGFATSGSSTTAAGTAALTGFANRLKLTTDGIFLEDGSGMSPMNSVTSLFMASLIRHMLTLSDNAALFRTSLPQAGVDGTMKNYFRDSFFTGRLRAKSGSMTRVRSFAGVFTGMSGKEFTFCIIVNNFSIPASDVIALIEDTLKELIKSN